MNRKKSPQSAPRHWSLNAFVYDIRSMIYIYFTHRPTLFQIDATKNNKNSQFDFYDANQEVRNTWKCKIFFSIYPHHPFPLWIFIHIAMENCKTIGRTFYFSQHVFKALLIYFRMWCVQNEPCADSKPNGCLILFSDLHSNVKSIDIKMFQDVYLFCQRAITSKGVCFP